jgi:large subunit ribosomal protein L31
MKKDVHPKYQKILFVDSSTGQKYLIGAAMQSQAKETHEGKEYPTCHVAISSSSHPFFVGGKQFVDTEGRVDKFQKRYLAVQQKAQVEQEKLEEHEKKQTLAKGKRKKKEEK